MCACMCVCACMRACVRACVQVTRSAPESTHRTVARPGEGDLLIRVAVDDLVNKLHVGHRDIHPPLPAAHWTNQRRGALISSQSEKQNLDKADVTQRGLL